MEDRGQTEDCDGGSVKCFELLTTGMAGELPEKKHREPKYNRNADRLGRTT